MSIHFQTETGVFHLQTNHTSYVMQIFNGKYVAHLYWGARIREMADLSRLIRYEYRPFSPTPNPGDYEFSPDMLPQEYPGYGTGDYRHPAYEIQFADGSTVSDFSYDSHTIRHGKPRLEGLPSTYTESDEEAVTLEILLTDAQANVQIIMTYTVFPELNVITRSVRFTNEGDTSIKLLRACSASVDFPQADMEMLQLSGAWSRERSIERRSLNSGMQSVESRRGSSSHQQNPFIAILDQHTTETQGDVFGFSFVYSGSFVAQAEVDQFRTTRVTMGINPFDFSWLLEPGESFQTPEVVMVYSGSGLGGMSRIYHRLYRTRLCRGLFRDKERPILANNWEATYFDFNADTIEHLARAGKDLGIELFVLDDGWFGKRNDDTTSLGDWFVDRNKLPDGLDDLARRINRLGLQFGLWFEPEMVSPESELYRNHPDWCLHVPGRSRTEARRQLILDLSREEVCDAIIKMMSDILDTVPVNYVKWDMNRNMTEIGSKGLPPERQRETAHRYMLGLYRVMETMTTRFPHVLFEGCSGGGGRFDPGILYYMPQIWTSDNTDAVSRLKIQYGTSIVYPISAMGAHVSAVPNHQCHRMTDLEMRGNVAMSGNFGYELDLNRFTDEDKKKVKQQVAFYKEIRPIIQFGEYYRLLSPFEHNEAAWMFVSPCRMEAIVFYYKILAEANEPTLFRLKLQGLDPEYEYEWINSEHRYFGDELMNAGILKPMLQGDFQSAVFHFRAVRM